MTHRFTRLLMAAAVSISAAAPASAARAQATPGALHLLDVPYLPQSEALCGGAAVAMVMRYWGVIGVYAETFSTLVDREAGGIRGEDLLRDLHARGWDARSFRGDAPLVQQQLSDRRPVIALIEDRPGRYHYVVIVGWAAGRVIVHDPARAPFRVLDEPGFTRAWSSSGYWTLLLTRSASSEPSPANPTSDRKSDATRARSDAPCGPMVDEGVRLGGAGEIDAARTVLEVASETCPASAAPWRELAGLHALRSEWRDAASDARQALAREENDEQAARILATALYLDGDTRGALDAWNRIGEPRLDLVNIKGLERTRYAIAATAMGLDPGVLLTPAALDRAARRLGEVPAAQVTRVNYRPAEDGRAQIDAVVLERPVAPASAVSLAAMGARALTDRELAAVFASPSGGGEAWTVSWRWWEHRRRVALRFDAPAPFGGTWGVQVFHERQTYATGGVPREETRRSASFHVGDWTARGLRWEASAGIDAWRDAGRAITAGVELEQRLLADRLALRGGVAGWTLDRPTWTAGLRTEWRSSVRNEGTPWLARGGVRLAGATSPLALWPGAGTGQGRDLLLRAHPLLHDGVVRDGVFGRRVFDAGAEWRMWRTAGRGLLRIAPAVFVDLARASRGLQDSDRRWHVDAGAGLRLAVPGSGVVRIDLARGLRDGAMALSAGWTR